MPHDPIVRLAVVLLVLIILSTLTGAYGERNGVDWCRTAAGVGLIVSLLIAGLTCLYVVVQWSFA
jgi:hypothetical protein